MYSVILGTSHVSEASCRPLLMAAILIRFSVFEDQPQGTHLKSRRRFFCMLNLPLAHFFIEVPMLEAFFTNVQL